jgi:hypothetical protein
VASSRQGVVNGRILPEGWPRADADRFSLGGRAVADSADPKEVGQTMEGHAGLQSAEEHELEAVEEDEEEKEEAVERAEHEEAGGA